MLEFDPKWLFFFRWNPNWLFRPSQFLPSLCHQLYLFLVLLKKKTLPQKTNNIQEPFNYFLVITKKKKFLVILSVMWRCDPQCPLFFLCLWTFGIYKSDTLFCIFLNVHCLSLLSICMLQTFFSFCCSCFILIKTTNPSWFGKS